MSSPVQPPAAPLPPPLVGSPNRDPNAPPKPPKPVLLPSPLGSPLPSSPLPPPIVSLPPPLPPIIHNTSPVPPGSPVPPSLLPSSNNVPSPQRQGSNNTITRGLPPAPPALPSAPPPASPSIPPVSPPLPSSLPPPLPPPAAQLDPNKLPPASVHVHVAPSTAAPLSLASLPPPSFDNSNVITGTSGISPRQSPRVSDLSILPAFLLPLQLSHKKITPPDPPPTAPEEDRPTPRFSIPLFISPPTNEPPPLLGGTWRGPVRGPVRPQPALNGCKLPNRVRVRPTNWRPEAWVPGPTRRRQTASTPDVQIDAGFRFSAASSQISSPSNPAVVDESTGNFRMNLPGAAAATVNDEPQSSSSSSLGGGMSSSRSSDGLVSRRPSSLQCPSGVTTMLALRTELWVGCEDGSIRRFSIMLRNEKTAIQAHSGQVSCLLLLANGTVVSSSSTDNDICLWSQKGELLSKVASKPVHCIVDAGEFLWCGTTGKKITVRTKDKLLKPKKELPLPDGGSARCMLQVGESIWVASNNSIILYDVLKLKLTRAIENVHSDLISSLVVGRRCVFSASYDHSIKVWSFDASEGKRLQQHTDKVLCLCNSPSRDLFFSGSCDKTVVSWSAHTHEQAAVDSVSHQAPVSSIIVVSVPEERRTELWTASLDGGIHIKPID